MVNKASTPVSIKEECVVNEEPSVEILKHTIVGTLANNQAKMTEPETKFEVLDEEINEDVSNVVQVELTEVDVVEPMMEDSDVDSLLLDEEMDSVDDNTVEETNDAGLTLETPNDDLSSEADVETLDKAGEYLANENEIFSEEESEEEEEEGDGSIEEGIEIESIVDRNEGIASIESDVESLGENDDSSDDDYDEEEEEEEISEDDEESIADEDTEVDEDENTDEEENADEDEIKVKEERAEEFPNGDIDTDPDANIQEEEKLLIENNNKESIKKEQTLHDSDFDFL